ncbi:hypothetical protein MMC12_008408 [Toensbergia leucococca]|nr:hypothetical protein [Toensbergia leucococca]
MTDVRSLLRNERASRRITHPQATYSTTGTLVCLVCHIQLKAESLWDTHLNSAQHAMRLQRIRDGTLGRPPGAPEPVSNTNGSKKRKANDGGRDSRKKPKAIDVLPQGFFDGDDAQTEPTEEADREVPEETTIPAVETSPGLPPTAPAPPTSQSITATLPLEVFDKPTTTTTTTKNTPTINEDEWDAFERDVATPPPEPSALTAAATISAAPLSAEEIAAQSRAEASAQGRERREEEVEGEKEDAARQMEEEFDEMAELEERVRRLREKRESLRKRREREVGEGGVAIADVVGGGEDASGGADEGDDNDDNEEYGWNDWDDWG